MKYIAHFFQLSLLVASYLSIFTQFYFGLIYLIYFMSQTKPDTVGVLWSVGYLFLLPILLIVSFVLAIVQSRLYPISRKSSSLHLFFYLLQILALVVTIIYLLILLFPY